MGEKRQIYHGIEKINTFRPIPKYNITTDLPTQPTFNTSALLQDLNRFAAKHNLTTDAIYELNEIVNKHADERCLQL